MCNSLENFSFPDNIYIYSVLWFIMAYFATSSYLLLSSQILETTDRVTSDWKWRLITGVFFQMSWTVGRLFCNFVVYVSQSWVDVILVLIVILLLVYFTFENNIWDDHFIQNKGDQGRNLCTFIIIMKLK